jgi:hypothetical protein
MSVTNFELKTRIDDLLKEQKYLLALVESLKQSVDDRDKLLVKAHNKIDFLAQRLDEHECLVGIHNEAI